MRRGVQKRLSGNYDTLYLDRGFQGKEEVNSKQENCLVMETYTSRTRH